MRFLSRSEIFAEHNGFAKNERANVSDKELKALKLLAKELLSYSAPALAKATEAGELIEIEVKDSG